VLEIAVAGNALFVGRRVLVVSTVHETDETLRKLLPEDVEEIDVVVPAVRQSVFDWLSNDERAFSEAQEAALQIADTLPGETVDAGAGEADVELAIRDALATFPADEVVVVLRKSDARGVVEEAATDDPVSMIAGVPVRRIYLDEE
jgi:hypothetical protein